MEEFKFNATGTDSRYLVNVNMFFAVLFTLDIFKAAWPEGKLGSQSCLQQAIDWFKQMFEGGLTGNRLHIAARKTARQDLDLRISRILHYLAVMADESDVSVLLSSGVVTRKTHKRARRAVKPVVAS